ncbi:hypothetical protein GX645_00190 [Candidatus Sumerlaeota bacterium]|nr:hypothetical protein [Candidatus Sumerlaeota bacterium]
MNGYRNLHVFALAMAAAAVTLIAATACDGAKHDNDEGQSWSAGKSLLQFTMGPAPKNILVNGSFDANNDRATTVPTGWSTNLSDSDTTVAAHAFEILPEGGMNNESCLRIAPCSIELSQKIKPASIDKLRGGVACVSFYMKTDDATTTGNESRVDAFVIVKATDTTTIWNAAMTVAPDGSAEMADDTGAIAPRIWTKYETNFPVSSDVTDITISFSAENPQTSETSSVLIDDVQVFRTDKSASSVE